MSASARTDSFGGGEAVLERQHRQRRPGRRLDVVPAPSAVQTVHPMIGEHQAQPLERALAGARDHDPPARRLLVVQMPGHGIEQVEILARPFGCEIARPATAEIDHQGVLSGGGRRGEGREVDPLAALEQGLDVALAEVELIGRERPIGRGAHAAGGLGRILPGRVMLADGGLARRQGLVGQRVEADPAAGLEIAEEVDEALVEQRQPMLHARERVARRRSSRTADRRSPRRSA